MARLALRNVSWRLVADVNAWARMRRQSFGDAATELLGVGIDVTSARHVVGTERQRAINTSDWDGVIDTLRSATPAAPAECTLWTLRKTGRTAEGRVRVHPHGQELRFLVNGELLWSEVFKPGRGVVLGEMAEAKRCEFNARGWE